MVLTSRTGRRVQGIREFGSSSKATRDSGERWDVSARVYSVALKS
jgi:hypothetical protein